MRSGSILAALFVASCGLPDVHHDPPATPPTDTATGPGPGTDTSTTAPPTDTGPFGCGDPGILCAGVGTGLRGLNPEEYTSGPLPVDQVWMNLVSAVGFDLTGHLIYADFENHRIRVVGDDGLVRTIAGSGFHANGIEGPALDSPLENPIDAVQCTAAGYFVDELHAARVDFVDTDGMLWFAAGTGGFEGYAGDGGPGTQALMSQSYGIACGPAGELYIADTENNVIRVLGTDGTIDTFAGIGTPGFVDGAGDAASFYRPQHMEVFAGGLYVADWLNHAIRRVDLATREVTTVAGNGTRGFSGDGGRAVDAQLRGPMAVGFAPDGTMYIADGDNQVIRAVDPKGFIRTVAGTRPGPELDDDGLPAAHPGYSGDGGPCAEAEMYWPNDVAVGPDGKVWFADTGNSVIRYFVPEPAQ